jgi:hypothetical protein
MSMRSVVAVLIAVAVVIVAGTYIASGWTPGVPADAGSVVLARTTLSGDVVPDSSVNQPALPPAGQDCLPRIERSTGWLDLCWEAYRTQDGDPEKDYYLLNIHGTVSGSGTGIRWWTARATLVGAYGQPTDGVHEGWPLGVFEGPCEPHVAPLWIGWTNYTETICGRTTGEYVASWGYRATWLCVGCVLSDRLDRSVTAYVHVGVPEGTVPAWDVGADFGD